MVDAHPRLPSSDSDKKVHQGWGGDEGNSELKAEAAAVTDAAAETNEWTAPADTADAWGAPADAPAGDAEAAGEKAERKPREPEEEDNTLTLDEYRKKQNSLDIVPKLEVRKVDDAAFKGAVAVTKKDEEETSYFVGKVNLKALGRECGIDSRRSRRLFLRPRPRRKRRSSSKSMLASNVPPVVAAVVVVASVVASAASVAAVAAVRVVAEAAVPTARAPLLLSTSTTRRHSRPWLKTPANISVGPAPRCGADSSPPNAVPTKWGVKSVLIASVVF